MKPLSREEAERRLREGADAETLKRLPPDVDHLLVVPTVIEILERSCWGFGRSCQRLPPIVVEAVLDELAGRPDLSWGTFLRAFVAEDEGRELQTTWKEALLAMLSLNTSYQFGSAKHKAKILSVAQDPRGLEAARAVAASAGVDQAVPRGMLSVLLLDGQEASLDALLPTLDRAMARKDAGLDQLLRLARVSSDDPRLQALLDGAVGAQKARAATSPGMELAVYLFGDDHPTTLWVARYFGSSEHGDAWGVPRIQGHVSIDSRKASAFSISISEGWERRTVFDANEGFVDDLGLGRCDAVMDLPAYIRRAEKKLKVVWDWGDPSSSLRGKKRTRMAEWLEGSDL